MAVLFTKILTSAEAQTYARDGAADAVQVCPVAADLYDDALMAALQGASVTTMKSLLAAANTACNKEAYGPGGSRYKAPTKPAAAAASVASPADIASGNDVLMFVGGGGGSTSASVSPAGGGLPWWAWVVGGVGLYLLFAGGKKVAARRKARK